MSARPDVNLGPQAMAGAPLVTQQVVIPGPAMIPNPTVMPVYQPVCMPVYSAGYIDNIRVSGHSQLVALKY